MKNEKETKASKALRLYRESIERRKAAIRSEPSRGKRLLKWIWFWVSHPFRWMWMSMHDWRTMLIFGIVFLVYSSSVWGFYLAAALTGWTTDTAKWLLGIGSSMWLFWLGPFTPFTELVIITTIGIKALVDRIKERRHGHMDSDTSGN